MNNEPHDPAASSRQCLSALTDGQADAAAEGLRLWREDRQARETWHLYHLIGDVLRSDELAQRPARDAAFLNGLRDRLAAEPVPLAPLPVAAAAAAPSAARRHLGWRAPAAVAAGFAVVGVALLLTRSPAPWSGAPGGGPQAQGLVNVSAPAGAAPVAAAPAAAPQPALASGPPQILLSGEIVRDARLDAYLRAHQAARGNAAAALPGGGLRSVEMLVTPLPPEAAATGAPR
jgi:sigma-E factor negative regulatory protein RseA